MAIQRPDPYSSFNFLVKFGQSNGTDALAGFQEVTGINIEVTSADYRVGNSVVNHPVKVNGVYKVGDVTFKRGLIGTLDLYTWIDGIRSGNHTVLSPVVVQLQDEAHNGPVFTITMVNARPIKYMAPAFNAKTGTEVAIEELVLSIEDLSIE